ncbi:MAG: PPOX class F420-dependent oxidoreductase [Chloroflexota bacterium]|nr:PPOX class F420-dependent oxidoreductase [Chloroflexota bacterium]
MNVPSDVVDLLRQPSTCYIATVMPDGGPQLTQVWVNTDGEHVIINTVQGFAKLRNIAHDPRVSVAVADPADSRRYVQIRGRVIGSTTEGGAEHIEMLSRKYLGQPYPWFGGRDQVRVILTIEADAISGLPH